MKTRFKWHRLLVNPTTHIESVEGDVVRLKVDGLVCSSVCAVRTKRALAALPGVNAVHVDFESGIVTIQGAPHDAAEYERAVTSVVALRWIRRLPEALARNWRSPMRRDTA